MINICQIIILWTTKVHGHFEQSKENTTIPMSEHFLHFGVLFNTCTFVHVYPVNTPDTFKIQWKSRTSLHKVLKYFALLSFTFEVYYTNCS